MNPFVTSIEEAMVAGIVRSLFSGIVVRMVKKFSCRLGIVIVTEYSVGEHLKVLGVNQKGEVIEGTVIAQEVKSGNLIKIE